GRQGETRDGNLSCSIILQQATKQDTGPHPAPRRQQAQQGHNGDSAAILGLYARHHGQKMATSSRNSSDSTGDQSSILSRSTSQLDLTSIPASSAAALQRLRPRRGSTSSSILSLNSSATALDWKGAKEAGP